MAKVSTPLAAMAPWLELAGEGFDETASPALARAEETGARFVHAAFEGRPCRRRAGDARARVAEQLPEGPATVVIPVGGGGPPQGS